MNKIELPKQVKDSNGEVYDLVSITVKNNDKTNAVPRDNFLAQYTEFLDPKDLEIERLMNIIKELETPKKPTKRRLLKGEWKEIEELIRKGEGNTQIANEYGISDSAVSKRRTEMRNNGEEV